MIGSELCFSIMSELLVEEPTGDKLEERGVRGERKGSGSRPGWPRWISTFVVKPNEKPYIFRVHCGSFSFGSTGALQEHIRGASRAPLIIQDPRCYLVIRWSPCTPI